MNYAFFQGCNIPVRIQQYTTSAEAVFRKFGVTLKIVPDFNCCGYPARNISEEAYILPSVRNMAIAEKLGLNILVICNCCFASLKKTKNKLQEDGQLRDKFNAMLANEGLQYKGHVTIKHFLTVFYEDIGPEKIKRLLVKKFKDLNIAVIYGCHILRPREITQFDDSFVPTITEELLQTVGAISIDWRGKLECCGAALAGFNDELSTILLKDKLSSAQLADTDYITPICSYCHLQFDTTQKNLRDKASDEKLLPVLLLPQLLGLCLDIDAQTLGIEQNNTIAIKDIQRLKSLLNPVVQKTKKKEPVKTH